MSKGKSVKTNKLTVYLIKEEYSRLEEIVNSSQTPMSVGDGCILYLSATFPNKPSWIDNFFGSSLSETKILTSSARGVLIVPISKFGRTFAITFGVAGRHFLNDGVIEDRFGLKVVLNSIAPTSFRSIQKTTLGPISKNSQEQISKEVYSSDFGI